MTPPLPVHPEKKVATNVRGRDIIRAIFDGCTGLCELRAIATSGKVRPVFIDPGDPDAIATFAAAHGGVNVYFGVATRRDASSGALANCQHLGALYVDLDCDADPDRLAAAETRLATFALPPSIVMGSGGGLHVYWLLREPADVQAEQPAIYSLLRRLTAALGGDPAAAEPARVLRVPSTRNYKYTPARRVTVSRFEPDRRYNLSEFDLVLPSEPGPVSTSPAQALDLRAIPAGTRNQTLYRLARTLRAKQLPLPAIVEAVRATNTTCETPLETRELDAIIRQATTQRDRPDFVPAVDHDAGPAIPVRHWPAPVGDAAYCGLFGEYVKALEAHTEADPIALLLHLLTSFGNVIGRTAHWKAEADVHYLTEFVALVGATSKGRKGVSSNQSRHLMGEIEPDWVKHCNKSGLSSGEGLIWAVRDPIEKQQPIKLHGRLIDYQTVIEDPGITDKRLYIIEAEFASTLRVLEREGNTLSACIRQAWDGQDLRVLTKNNPATSTAPHISAIVHITGDEVRRELGRTEAGNGFGNRFLWACVRRSRVLPEGGGTIDWDPLVTKCRTAIEHARTAGEMKRDPEAAKLWRKVYGPLSDGRPGLLGAMTARAEAHVMRLACLYALGDMSKVVRRVHLRAALALWRYLFNSARYIFGDKLGDQTADTILQALRAAGTTGLTRADLLHDVFGRNKLAADIARALGMLEEAQLAQHKPDTSGGGVKPAERWFATSKGDDVNDINDVLDQQTAPEVVNVVNVVPSIADELDQEQAGEDDDESADYPGD